MKYLTKDFRKCLVYLVISALMVLLLADSNRQQVIAQELSESATESSNPGAAETDATQPSESSPSTETTQPSASSPSAEVAQPYQMSEAQLKLLREFPFESIVGFSWPLYSERPLSEIYAEFSPKVGAIYSGKTVANQDSVNYQVMANGFFITSDGKFITTFSRMRDVFSDRNEIDSTIELKLKTHHSLKLIDLSLIKSDPEGDIVIFQTNLEQLGIPEVPFVEFSQFSPAMGQPVFGIGFPDILAVEGGLFPGFVTEINATKILESGYGLTEIISSSLIPNTAAGCLIVNSGGQAIGISTSAGLRSVSDRYSIFYPSNQIVSRLDYLLSDTVDQTMVWTGITLLSDLDYLKYAETFHLPSGCYVTGVFVESPAYVSDIRKDDIILSVNGSAVNSGTEFREILKTYHAGDALEVKIYRPNLDKEYVRTLYLDSK